VSYLRKTRSGEKRREEEEEEEEEEESRWRGVKMIEHIKK